MRSMIANWRTMTRAERSQYLLEVWALVSLSVLMTLSAIAFIGAPNQTVFLNTFGSLQASLWFGAASLLCALAVPLLFPFRNRLSTIWKRRLYIVGALPLLFYMFVVIVGVMSFGLALISYGFTFNLLSLVGVLLYPDRRE